MTFQVRWDQTALDELATVWMRADSALRRRITEVVHAIEKKLQTHPQEIGESREEGERIVIALPLGLICEI
jgi:hypothetical protein